MMTFSHLGALKRRNTKPTAATSSASSSQPLTALDVVKPAAARGGASGGSATAAAQRKQIVLAKAHLALNRRRSKLSMTSDSRLSAAKLSALDPKASTAFERNASSMSNVSQNMAAEIRAAMAELMAAQDQQQQPIIVAPQAPITTVAAQSSHTSPARSFGAVGVNTPCGKQRLDLSISCTPLRTPAQSAIRPAHQVAVSPPPSARGAALPCATAHTQLEAIDLDFVHALETRNNAEAARAMTAEDRKLKRMDSMPNRRLQEDVQLLASDSETDEASAGVAPADATLVVEAAGTVPQEQQQLRTVTFSDVVTSTSDTAIVAPSQHDDEAAAAPSVFADDQRPSAAKSGPSPCFSCLVM